MAFPSVGKGRALAGQTVEIEPADLMRRPWPLAWLTDVLDRHDAVAKILAEATARYASLFMHTDEGTGLVQDWAAGSLAAVRLRLEAWRLLLKGPAWIGCCCRSWSTR
jgi:hypothetical protein